MASQKWHIPQCLGILTGISYVSGLDYFKGINERVLAEGTKGHLMVPNPQIIMSSVNCDEYAHHLVSNQFDKVDEHLLSGISKLVNAGCDLLVIASNTGHICFPTVKVRYPELQILHIADCCALQLKAKGFTKVGLIGTKPTMVSSHFSNLGFMLLLCVFFFLITYVLHNYLFSCEKQHDYLKDRLALHGISTIVPETDSEQEEIFRIIMDELSYNKLIGSSRETLINSIEGMIRRGAETCLLGCTEIELLVPLDAIPNVTLLPSAEIHMDCIAQVLLGKICLEDILPKNS